MPYKFPISSNHKGEVKAKIVLSWSDPDDNFYFSFIQSNPTWTKMKYSAIIVKGYGKGSAISSAALFENERNDFKELFIHLLKNAGILLFQIEDEKEIEIVSFRDGKEYYVFYIDFQRNEYVKNRSSSFFGKVKN